MFGVAVYEVNTFSNFASPPLYFDIQQHREAILERISFYVVLHEVHMLNFGSPPSYHDIQQHRDALISCGAATTLAVLCGSLYVKGSWPEGFRMVGLTSALSVSCGLM